MSSRAHSASRSWDLGLLSRASLAEATALPCSLGAYLPLADWSEERCLLTFCSKPSDSRDSGVWISEGLRVQGELPLLPFSLHSPPRGSPVVPGVGSLSVSESDALLLCLSPYLHQTPCTQGFLCWDSSAPGLLF